MLETFENFLKDEEAWDMYISGVAGTGKTTSLIELLEYCKEKELPTLVCAHTHKACNVIRDIVPSDTNVSTLHSFLNKRPGINDEATEKAKLNFIHQLNIPEAKGVIFIDEYSMVADIDMCDIIVCQDPDYEGIPKVKVVYIGDPNQLPPIGEPVAIRPKGKYCIYLTKIYRQDNDNPLKDILTKLISYIEKTAEPATLIGNKSFIRNSDLKHEYEINEGDNKILCYTNEAVQQWNIHLQGRDDLCVNDIVMSPTTREEYTYQNRVLRDHIAILDLPRERQLPLGTKFKTLEFLLKMKNIEFGKFDDKIFAYIFGHYNYKKMVEFLSNEALQSNRNIEREIGLPAKNWAKNNNKNPLARKRAKAWREYLSFQDSVICIDFNHAMTIHKSQGSTYDNVFLDSKDLDRCTDINTMLRLWYVALSRAKYKVYVNE